MADPLELAFVQRPFKLFLDKRQYPIQTFTTNHFFQTRKIIATRQNLILEGKTTISLA